MLRFAPRFWVSLALLACGAAGATAGMLETRAAALADSAWAAPSAALPAAAQAAQASLAELNALIPGHAQGAFAPLVGVPFVARPVPLAADDARPAPPAELRELPPAPGSAALVVAALASLGAWQGLRSLRKVHFGGFAAVPDWYHADAVQVGHSTPLALEFDYSALSLCVLDTPLPAPRPIARLAWADPPPLITLFTPPNRIPRGPPLGC